HLLHPRPIDLALDIAMLIVDRPLAPARRGRRRLAAGIVAFAGGGRAGGEAGEPGGESQKAAHGTSPVKVNGNPSAWSRPGEPMRLRGERPAQKSTAIPLRSQSPKRVGSGPRGPPSSGAAGPSASAA